MPRVSNAYTLLLMFVVAVLVLPSVSRSDIVLDKAFPTVRQPTKVHVADDVGNPIGNAEVTVTYRPGSAVENNSVVGHTGVDGSLTWAPAEAGIVTITAVWIDSEQMERSESINSSIKFDPTPVAGIIIMIVAGIVLIGGSIERIWTLLRAPGTD